VYVAHDAERHSIRGYIVFYPRSDHVHLENVAVVPSSQGRGIGSALIDFAEQQALRLGFERI
jgi:ribosomal protein S18 acetylase RimI-like enzyme